MPAAVLTISSAGPPSEVSAFPDGSPMEHDAGDTHSHVILEEGDLFPEPTTLCGS